MPNKAFQKSKCTLFAGVSKWSLQNPKFSSFSSALLQDAKIWV